ncbi:hypothetical protein WKI40_14855 [Kosakonia sacchari]|uniref:hypothetical protein n=1 Tax=Kosakonia sacchari TaxID=1158459 RepID=UPI0030BF3F3A
MHNNHIDRNKMPFFDTFKTAATVGLLMQQVSVMPCAEGGQAPLAPFNYQLSKEASQKISNLMITEALEFITELTASLNKAYSLLVSSNDDNRSYIIKTLNPEQVDLVELQLRGLEGAIKNVYNDCKPEKKALLKPSLLVIAKARASATKLNHLILQMTKPINTIFSDIDMDGLRTLAKHGTEVFTSGRFH